LWVAFDNDIVVGAMLREGGAARAVLRLCLQGDIKPIVGVALFAEMEDVLTRDNLFRNYPLTLTERQDLFSAYLSVTKWVPIYYRWRPNLRDEADNYVVDLAVAGNAEHIITNNERDFFQMELLFPQIKLATAVEFMELWRKR
jgi:putative PIN family toxin of toxin-antitoxin system